MHTTAWMNIDIIRGEISPDTEGQILTWRTWEEQITETNQNGGFPGWGRGIGQLLFNGYGVSLCPDEKYSRDEWWW